MKKVDTHAHVFSMNQGVVANARYSPDYSATVDQYITHLDRHGFEYGVLIQPSFLGYDNSQMLKALATYPERLKGIAVLPLDVSKQTLVELKAQGIEGIRLNLFGKAAPDLRQADWQRFLKEIAALNWQIELHCPPSYLVQMLPILKQYPGPLVLDHFARVDPVKGVQDPDFLMVLDQLDPLLCWIKVSGYYRLGENERGKKNAKDVWDLLIKHRLTDRLVWGSDWPHTQYEQHINYAASLGFLYELVKDETLRQSILSENALTLYGFTS